MQPFNGDNHFIHFPVFSVPLHEIAVARALLFISTPSRMRWMLIIITIITVQPAVLVRLQTAVGAEGVWGRANVTRPIGSHLATRHCALQQVSTC